MVCDCIVKKRGVGEKSAFFVVQKSTFISGHGPSGHSVHMMLRYSQLPTQIDKYTVGVIVDDDMFTSRGD